MLTPGPKGNKYRADQKHKKSKLYMIFVSFHDRAYNPRAQFYKNYGGRGIVVCDEWRYDFQKFYVWAMTHGYQQGLDLDRIANDGPYSPENCKFSTRTQNQRNRRIGVFVEIDGNRVHFNSFLESIGISDKRTQKSMLARHLLGWPMDRILNEPIIPKEHIRKNYEFEGQTYKLADLWIAVEHRCHVSKKVFAARLGKNWSIADAISIPMLGRGNRKPVDR